MEPAVCLTRVSFQYKGADRPALRDVSFSLSPGECALITGPAASGKTTLCHSLNGLVPQVREGRLKGDIRVAGMDVTRFRVQTLARKAGLVMQDPEIQIVGRTIAEDLAFGPRNYLMPAEDIPDRISRAMALAGLDLPGHRPTAALSGGEKQRLAIAGVLAMSPSVLILDEPASELDPAGRSDLYRCLFKLKQDQGLTLIIVEKKTDDLRDMADQVLVMDDGRLKKQSVYRNRAAASPAVPVRPRQAAAGPEAPAALAVRNLSYAPAGPVLDAVNLTIYQDDFIALMGHNGAGKSSLARHLNGLIPCRSGSVSFYGKDVGRFTAPEMAGSVGFVFQNPDHQIFESSVEKEVGFGLTHQGLGRKEIKERVDEALHLTGLESVRHAHPFTLGKGLRQLIAVAAILVLTPRVLVLDEPVTGLDARGTARVMEILENLHRAGTAILLITHDMDLAVHHARRLVVMKAGQIALDAPIGKALEHPALLRDAGLMPEKGLP